MTAARNAMMTALDDCIKVMDGDLRGLAVIQRELEQARAALALARTEGPPAATGECRRPSAATAEPVQFHALPKGARFSYEPDSDDVWVVLQGFRAGLIARWTGVPGEGVWQSLCSAAESEEQAKALMVYLREPATAPSFPTMLRKMWTGGEVQEWIDANWPKDGAA